MSRVSTRSQRRSRDMVDTPIHDSNNGLDQLLSARQYEQAGFDLSIAPTSPSALASEQPRDTSPQEALDSTVSPKDISMAPRKRHKRKSAGRPRIEVDENAVLSENRRQQIRRAQKTYRLRKEAALQETNGRLVELQVKLNQVTESLDGFYHASLEADLHVTHPALLEHLEAVRGLLKSDHQSISRSSFNDTQTPHHEVMKPSEAVYSHPDTRGKRTNCPRTNNVAPESQCTITQADQPLLTEETISPPLIQDVSQSLGNTSYTYAFQETEFSRRLQRYCLEHAFRLFSDPRSHPLEVYRVFRLVPCMKDKERMYPHFKRLVSANINGKLEISSLPFYCVGGAGTHYPAQDSSGDPIYPANMRLPKRILGLFPLETTINAASSNADVQHRLEICGFGGQWFDCRDVEGYLRERGVCLDESSLFPVIYNSSAYESPNSSPHEREISKNKEPWGQSRISADQIAATEGHRNILHGPTASRSVSYVLDIESFFKRLLRCLVFLGRVPGFRQSDVVLAFKSTSS